jgi:hypothetical protein
MADRRKKHIPNNLLFCKNCGVDIIGCGSVYCDDFAPKGESRGD